MVKTIVTDVDRPEFVICLPRSRVRHIGAYEVSRIVDLAGIEDQARHDRFTARGNLLCIRKVDRAGNSQQSAYVVGAFVMRRIGS